MPPRRIRSVMRRLRASGHAPTVRPPAPPPHTQAPKHVSTFPPSRQCSRTVRRCSDPRQLHHPPLGLGYFRFQVVNTPLYLVPHTAPTPHQHRSHTAPTPTPHPHRTHTAPTHLVVGLGHTLSHVAALQNHRRLRPGPHLARRRRRHRVCRGCRVVGGQRLRLLVTQTLHIQRAGRGDT